MRDWENGCDLSFGVDVYIVVKLWTNPKRMSRCIMITATLHTMKLMKCVSDWWAGIVLNCDDARYLDPNLDRSSEATHGLDLQTLKAAAENLLPTSTSSRDRVKQMYIKGIKFGCLHAAIPARDLTPNTNSLPPRRNNKQIQADQDTARGDS